ncbi:MAG: SEC-C metal-binding domain-containing protein [Nitrospiraceae bacterium]|nr:SEC-C metal-binding domain-containing protein [Nitrospiraceae bacterium]
MGILKSIIEYFVPAEDQSVPNLGRNDACWCGSGKKYKKCHLHKDEDKLRKKSVNCGTA